MSYRYTKNQLVDEICEKLLGSPHLLVDAAELVGMTVSSHAHDYLCSDGDDTDCCCLCGDVMQPEHEEDHICVHCGAVQDGYERCLACDEIQSEDDLVATSSGNVCESCAEMVEHKLDAP